MTYFNSEINSISILFLFLQLYKYFVAVLRKKMNLALLFRFKKAENQYMSHKKYGVHLGLSGPFDLVCLQYSSSVRKTHSPSARVSSPTTRTANSTLGLKWTTSRPRYTIYYFLTPGRKYQIPARR